MTCLYNRWVFLAPAIFSLLLPGCMARQEAPASQSLAEGGESQASPVGAPDEAQDIMMDEIATTEEAAPAPEPIASVSMKPAPPMKKTAKMEKMDAEPADSDDMQALPAPKAVAKKKTARPTSRVAEL